MKAISGKILILTSLLVLCIVLPFDYFRRTSAEQTLSQRIQDLNQGILRSENEQSAKVNSLSTTAFSGKLVNTAQTEELLLGGTCFFEIHEIDQFLMGKLQESDELSKLYPPLNLTVDHADEGIALLWSPNPQNVALIKNLAGNPLLTLSYKIYRWTSDGATQPVGIKTLPYNRTRFVDKDVSPIATQYFYSVMLVFEGTVGQERTLIESERSVVRSITCRDRFKLSIVKAGQETAEVMVSQVADGQQLSHVFPTKIGDLIGGVVEILGKGPVDFSTSLKLIDIKKREENKEEMVQHPLFNSDGSRALDPLDQEPIFQEKPEIRTHEIISIECEDPSGKRRIIEES